MATRKSVFLVRIRRMRLIYYFIRSITCCGIIYLRGGNIFLWKGRQSILGITFGVKSTTFPAGREFLLGALLFRGFPVISASDFNTVVEAFGWEEQPYLGLASRTKIEGRVYTANEAPVHQPIKFHHEMATVSWSYPFQTTHSFFSFSFFKLILDMTFPV